MLFALSISGQNETSVLTGCHVLEACEGYCIGVDEEHIYTTGIGKGDEYPVNNVQGVYIFKYDKEGKLINMEIDSDENSPIYFQNNHNDLFIVENRIYSIVNGLSANDYVMIYDIENDTIESKLSYLSNTPDAVLQPVGLTPWDDDFTILFINWKENYNNIVVQYGLDQDAERTEFDFSEIYTAGRELVILSDSTFLVGGFSILGSNTQTTGLLFKGNIEGEIEWRHYIELENPNIWTAIRKVIKTPNEEYIVSFTSYLPPGRFQPCVRKVDINGDELWTKVLGGNHWDYDLLLPGIRQIIPSSHPEKYVYIGTRKEQGSSSGDDQSFGMIGKFDEDGNDVWTKKVSIPDKSNLQEVTFLDMQKFEDNYFIVGSFFFKDTPENEPRVQQCILKVDEDGNLIPFNSDSVSVSFEEDSKRKIALFPNPTSDYLMLDTKGCSNCKFTIVNSVGQRLKSFTTQSNNETLIIDTSRYRTGLYYLVVENTDISENTKLRFMVE